MDNFLVIIKSEKHYIYSQHLLNYLIRKNTNKLVEFYDEFMVIRNKI